MHSSHPSFGIGQRPVGNGPVTCVIVAALAVLAVGYREPALLRMGA